VRVVGHDFAGAAEHGEEQLLRGAALVRGHHMLERKQILDSRVEALEGGATREASSPRITAACC
jgi:hypothetical protein